MKPLLAALALSLLTDAALADTVTIYRYRDTDGRSHFSDTPIPGARLMEKFRYEMPVRQASGASMSKSDADGLIRIDKHLSALEAAWNEVQESERALAAAEQRRAAGAAPNENEVVGLASPGPAAPPPSAGGPGEA